MAPAWVSITVCPVCGAEESIDRGLLGGQHYVFASIEIPYPKAGIHLRECENCGIVFKNVVPNRQFLRRVLSSNYQDIWTKSPRFCAERTAIQHYIKSKDIDVLDIGAGSGGFLLSLRGVSGRKSVLDVVEFPAALPVVKGEYIRAMLDDTAIEWSRQAYDVVTMFDVAEHLYAPQIAFENLRAFLKDGGIVMIETGDIRSAWPNRYGMSRWWYVQLFEHHVFWSVRSLSWLAKRNGFTVISVEHKRHKSKGGQGALRFILDTVGTVIYRISDRWYEKVAAGVGRNSIQPWSHFVRDHLRVILRRGSST
jgi:SAM-dependent methyltransferase